MSNLATDYLLDLDLRVIWVGFGGSEDFDGLQFWESWNTGVKTAHETIGDIWHLSIQKERNYVKSRHRLCGAIYWPVAIP